MQRRTLHLIILLTVVGVLLNVMNYMFYCFYKPPSRRAYIQSSDTSKIRRFTPGTLETRAEHISNHWKNYLIPENLKTAKKPTPGSEQMNVTSSSEFQIDYHDQSTETNGYYYYNGIRKGPNVCPERPPGLGPIKPYELVDLETIENLFTELQPGGVYEVTKCAARQSVAVIVPFNGQKTQLTEFLYSIHPFLIKQQLEYRIFVIAQGNKTQPLNEGKLLNAGFTEAQRLKKNGGWRCVVFHHQDVVPVDTRNLYRCTEQPRQLIMSLTNTNQTYEFTFGGGISINPKQFSMVNGFSNQQFGFRSVYEDLYKRLHNANFTIKVHPDYCKYTRISNIDKDSTTVTSKSDQAALLNMLDGLSNLSYKVKKMDLKPLFTYIEIDLEPLKEEVPDGGVVNENLLNGLIN